MSDLPYRLSRAVFHGPLSETRAARLVARAARREPRTVLDIGCGWGEMLFRLLEAVPDATGVGIDLDAEDLARARALAAARGLAGRVELVEESGHGTQRAPADLVVCLGASHALSGAEAPDIFVEALTALRRLVNPGGRVLWSEGFWQREPTSDELARMWPEAAAENHTDLAGLTELAIRAGFRIGWMETANEDEWEEFESAYQADGEEWLAAHGEHPRAAEIRDRLDGHRTSWLTGYRGVLGMAYLTLLPAS